MNPSHEIFKAHFPDRPIMPGVCQIQMVTEILASHMGSDMLLTDIKNVKYLSVISPDEVTELDVRFLKITCEDGACSVSAILSDEIGVFSKMSMTCHVVRSDSDL